MAQLTRQASHSSCSEASENCERPEDERPGELPAKARRTAARSVSSGASKLMRLMAEVFRSILSKEEVMLMVTADVGRMCSASPTPAPIQHWHRQSGSRQLSHLHTGRRALVLATTL